MNAWELLFADNLLFEVVSFLRHPMIPDPYFGGTGIRDSNNPCADFTQGQSGTGNCDTDGHYMCYKCAHMSKIAVEFRKDPY
jgi:hypothetical protein